jgi:hypothetical protein
MDVLALAHSSTNLARTLEKLKPDRIYVVPDTGEQFTPAW